MRAYKLILFLLLAPNLFAAQWYVRTDGGTPYTNATNTPHGQCDGKSDLAYPGLSNVEWEPGTAYALNALIADNQGFIEKATTAGTSNVAAVPSWGATTSDGTVGWTRQSTYPVNQPCAMGNLMYLWADQVTSGKTWMIAGGDTVNIRAGSYPQGWKSPWGLTDPNCGSDNLNCFMPTPPAGTSGAHTKFVGAGSATTELYGTWGTDTVFQMRGPSSGSPLYVDLTGIKSTDHSACGIQNQAHACDGIADGSSWAISSNVATVQTQTTITITGWSIVTTGTPPNTFTTVTFTTAPQALQQSQNVAISGFTNGTFFNGHTVGVNGSGLTSTQFETTYETYMGADATGTETSTNNGMIINGFVPGNTVMLSGFATGSFFNKQLVTVTAATPTQYQFAFTHANTSATETGLATIFENHAKNGIEQNNWGCNKTYTDVVLLGFSHDGIYGTQCNDTTTNLQIIANAAAGLDMDDNGGDSSTITGTNLNVGLVSAYNGCAHQWPVAYPSANSVGDCVDQDFGGYGDGIGTNNTNNPGAFWSCDQCQVFYNTQDGADTLHNYGAASITRSLFYGNEGNQVKVGGGPSVINNNQIFENCMAMRQPAFGPFTATYNARLGLFCRAGGELIFRTDDSFGAPTKVQGNTIEGWYIGVAAECLTTCTVGSSWINLSDNLMLLNEQNAANGDPSNPQTSAVPIYLISTGDGEPALPAGVFTGTGAANDHNFVYWQSGTGTCPASAFFPTNWICSTASGVVNPAWPVTGYNNVSPVNGSSAVVGAGVTISGLTVDYTGVLRPSPPSTGALDFIAGPSTAAYSSGSAFRGGAGVFQ